MGKHADSDNKRIGEPIQMNIIDAYSKLKALGQATITTHDAAKILQIDISYASKILSQLNQADQMIKIGRGKWVFPDRLDRFALPEYITAPFPAYISLQSALYQHGMISQIPSTIYVVSLARTKKVSTKIAVVSIHHIHPDLFTGYETIGKQQIKIATPEKALFDYFYFSRTSSKLFHSLPELELPADFDTSILREYITIVKSKSITQFIRQKFAELGINID